MRDTSYKKLLLASIHCFDLNLNALDKFINKEAYFRVLSNCKIVIMNHIRQQAGGNIIVMLFMSAKVFLNKSSPFYEFYRSKGAIIYTVEELKQSLSLLKGYLSEREVAVNRKVVLDESEENSIISKTMTWFNGFRHPS